MEWVDVDEFGCGLDVEEAVADVLIDLLDLVGELGFGLLVLGVGDLLLAPGLGDLQDGDADLAGGREGAVRVAGGGADVAVVAATLATGSGRPRQRSSWRWRTSPVRRRRRDLCES